MELLPIFLNIKGRQCLIVGGGELAFRKATLLNKASANIKFVANEFSENIESLATKKSFLLIKDSFKDKYLENIVLVIAATNCKETNTLIAKSAKALNIPVNVVDTPSLCSFIIPAVVDRSPVVVAISSAGNSPVLTRKIKELNESMLSDKLGELALLLGSYREKVKSQFTGFSHRLQFWENILESEVTELVYSGNYELAKKIINTNLFDNRLTCLFILSFAFANPGCIPDAKI